ncbi:MAG: pantoate--beta-alanine ligase [bacterium]
MRIIDSPSRMRAEAEALRGEGGPLGLVPTMGALHEGHLSLVRRAVGECAAVVVSIFLNPSQFGPGDDLDAYPSSWEADLAACRAEGAAAVYAPSAEAMYPPGFGAWVEVPSLAAGLCGPHRPGHFRGVATVVLKLFAACRPDRAYFGAKDYQQLVLIRRMARDLDLGVEVIGCPIVRDRDGLALSSRNRYLDEEERERALSLSRGLRRAESLLAGGERGAGALIAAAREEMERARAEIDYIAVVDPETLAPLERVEGPARMAVAARVGKTRLIDNIPLEP